MISDRVGAIGTAFKARVAAIVTRLGVPPNIVTLSSLVPMVLAAWNLEQGRMLSAASWILVGGALDLIDGAVARYSGKASEFGAVLDSVIDRASDTLVYAGAIYYFHTVGSSLYVALGALALGGSIGVSYARARAENVIPECRVGFAERGERIVLLMLGLFFGRLAQAIALLAFLTWLTTVQRLLHAYRVIGERDALRAVGREDELRRGMDIWGTTGRWVFLNWPRGSWQFDLIAAAVIVALFVLPGI
jgi:phosphatidylglycerophosphate synthase